MQFYKAVYFNVREKWKGYLPTILCKSLSTVRVNIYTYCTWSSSSILMFSRDFIICVAYLVLFEKAKACWIDSNVNLRFQQGWDERWGFKVPLITWYYYNNLMPCVTYSIVLIIILSNTSTLFYFSILFIFLFYFTLVLFSVWLK